MHRGFAIALLAVVALVIGATGDPERRRHLAGTGHGGDAPPCREV